MDAPIIKGRVEEAPATPDVKPSERVIADVKAPNDLYATYELDNDRPFLADHFGLKDLWNDPGLTYKTEINSIDEYLMGEIKGKSLDNSTTAVKDRLQKLEKLAGVEKDAPVELKVRQLAEFAKYLTKLESVKLGMRFNG